MSSGVPDPHDHPTVQFPTVQGIPPVGYAIAPPGGARRVIHSWLFYIAVIGALPVLFWGLSSLVNWHPVLVIPTVILTLITAALLFMRYWRGSQLDAEVRLLEERLAYFEYIEQNGPVVIEPSNRIGQQLGNGEHVLWEFRRHPIGLVRLWWKHLARTPVGLMATAIYTIGIVATLFWGGKMEVPWLAYVCFIILPVPYFVYTIAEWNADRFALTNLRFMGAVGLIKTQFGAIPRVAILDQVQTTTGPAHLLAWLRIIDTPYGRVVFETPGPVRGNLPEIVDPLAQISHYLAKFQPRKF